MNIIYACTQNYYQYMPTIINSVLVNNPSAVVYVFAEDDSIPNINHSKVNIINVNKYPALVYNDNKSFTIYSKMVAYKLAVTKFLPELDRALFLDVDTMVDGDLTELYELDMTNYFYAMAYEYRTMVTLHAPHYFNAGVILMNLKEIRERSIEDMLLNRLNMMGYNYIEQEVLNNWVSTDSILELNSKWNFCLTSKFPTEKPIIWHYQNIPKQWDKRADGYTWNKYYVEKLEDEQKKD